MHAFSAVHPASLHSKVKQAMRPITTTRLLSLLILALAEFAAGDAVASDELAISAAQAELVGIETAALEQQPASPDSAFRAGSRCRRIAPG